MIVAYKIKLASPSASEINIHVLVCCLLKD